MSTDRINWIDLSDYGITLHALRLPSQRVVLVAAGNTRAHEAALAALGFRRTRQGHVVHPETKLALKTVQAQFPLARVAALAREQVIRIVPARIAPAIPFSPQETVERLPADGGAPPNSDHLIHGAVWLGVNRRGQAVYSDGADNRYLEGLAREDFGPESDVDFLRAPTAAALPEMMLGMARRAAQGEHLHADDLLQLARHIEAPWWDRPPEERLHTLQEALEVAATHFIRTHYGSGEPWQDDHQKGKSLYRAAVHLNAHLPTVQRRTDETLRLAQFSSPLPLAIAMRTLLGPIGSNRTVLEPTAGHGALLQGLPTDTRITAVEISPERAERLRWAWGDRAEIVTGDILKTPFPEEPYDYILANPPYGALAHYPDWPSTAQVRFGDIQFPTRRLDQLILLQTLKQRHPQGRAVFLIGADHPMKNVLEKPAGGSRYLLNLLADHYHVEAVLGIHGDLYRQQGAGYPMRLIVIGEQGQGFPAVPERTPVARDWDELWTQVETLATRWGPSALERAAPIALNTPAVDRAADDTSADTNDTNDTNEDNSASVFAIDDELDALVYQEPYSERSQVGTSTTRAPANMAAGLSRAFDRVEAAHGMNVDQYVWQELGLSYADLQDRFAPEQVDALALLFHAHDRGRGFIEADETGIGKGRVLAGAALRAWRQGQLVVFLTEKANLFSDFYRDLRHIGVGSNIVPFVLNPGVAIIDTERGQTLIKPLPEQERRKYWQTDTLPMGTNLVLATYSQFRQAVSAKTGWLRAIVEREGALVIADEAHNATGTESNTARNILEIIEASGHPPLFASATYAKRPDSWGLYASVLPTRFREDDVAEMLKSGGAALQETFSQMLAEDGVLIRREHDLSNIEFRVPPDTERAGRNRQLTDQLASILEKMAWLGGDIELFLSEENQRLNEQYDGDNTDQRGGKRAGLHTVNFGSRLYQLNRLFLLALKVEQAVEFGTQELEAGRKPIFVLENTMETLLREVIANQFDDTPAEDEAQAEATPDPRQVAEPVHDNPLVGQAFPELTFRDALSRVLARMMRYNERDRYGGNTPREVDRPDLVQLAKNIEQDIQGFPDLPLSPLDTLRISLNERGYRVGELSGRGLQVNLIERPDGRQMTVRPRVAESRSECVYRFNTDHYQALLMTRSGSTGLSAHARDDVPGWSPAPRTLYELQIPQNVAERIQFWGRVNRRGQCATPTVITPSSELPAEVRLIAMQNAKLRQLSANTTSNQDNAALARNIPDLLNPLGNEIARKWAQQNPVDAGRLDALPSRERDAMPDWYVNRILSRIVLFPVSQQEQVLEELAGLYRTRLEELRNQGIEPMRTTEFNWKARTRERAEFEGVPAGEGEADSPFHAPVDFITVEYAEECRPLRSGRVQQALEWGTRLWRPAAVLRDFLCLKQAKLAEAIQPNGRFKGFASVHEALDSPEDNRVKKVAQQLAQIEFFIQDAQVGSAVEWSVPVQNRDRLNTPSAGDEEADDETEYENRLGLIVSINPPTRDTLHLAGHYEVRIACPGDERWTRVSLHTLLQGSYRLFPPDEQPSPLLPAFDEFEAGTRTVQRNLLVGNLYSALQIADSQGLGHPVIYTTEAGARERGVLLYDDVDLALLRSQPVLLRRADQLQRFVDDHRAGNTVLVACGTGGRPEHFKRGVDFVLTLKDGELSLSVPGAHSRNGKLLHDSRWASLDITLEGTRAALSGPIPPDRLERTLIVLGEKFNWYIGADYRDWYNTLSKADPLAKDQGDSPDKPEDDPPPWRWTPPPRNPPLPGVSP